MWIRLKYFIYHVSDKRLSSIFTTNRILSYLVSKFCENNTNTQDNCTTKDSSDDSLSTSSHQSSASSLDEDSIEEGEITPSDTDEEASRLTMFWLRP